MSTTNEANTMFDLRVSKGEDGQRKMELLRVRNSSEFVIPTYGFPIYGDLICSGGRRSGRSVVAMSNSLVILLGRIKEDERLLVVVDDNRIKSWETVVKLLDTARVDVMTGKEFTKQASIDVYPLDDYKCVLIDLRIDKDALRYICQGVRMTREVLLAIATQAAPVNNDYRDVIAGFDAPWKNVTPTGKF